MSLPSVRTAYGARAREYIDAVGGIHHVAAGDLALVERWALGIEGAVLDVGCGPGQWTHHLSGLGGEVAGIDAALSEFARCIRPGGGRALGFFTGPQQRPFAHAIATAYSWPIDLLTREVEAAGFAVTHTESRAARPERTHGAIIATRV